MAMASADEAAELRGAAGGGAAPMAAPWVAPWVAPWAKPWTGPWEARAALAAAVLGGALAGGVWGGHDAAGLAAADPQYAMLMRAMAGLKAVFALAAAGAVFWRLGAPAAFPWLAAYLAAAAAMAAGPGLIWGIAHIGLGALLLHGGLLATVLLLWRDRAVGERLAAIVAARRAAIRAR
ncbi:MAG: hypothetical protein JSR21_08635 [Proteobacteria bacterium]|nr:hypothetical protein [Pseudomonadota bacterium]